MLNAVIFDVGGTLGHGFGRFERIHEEIIAERPALRKFLNKILEQFRATRARDLVTLEQHTFTEVFLAVANEQQPATSGAHLWELHDRIVNMHMESSELFPETVGVLETLRTMGLGMGIISNVSFPGRYYERTLANWRIRQYFSVQVWSSEEKMRKPHGEIFHRALDAMGVAPEHALYVGDTVDRDVVGAKRARIPVVLVDRKGRHAPGKGVQPDWVIPDLRGLIPIVASLREEP
ncbi:MAG: hypothetical protein A2991_00865 [Candidatus Terrybacteria bacterium RIFCSPLOWO2_01_FULL_58_14]|uniref:Haloacid dehalogenase n=2 Tax=Candidatus Terryibacteriota TaxID=1817920 RepID=A0A1G2PZP0_9BACT|nr:MAG: hypothetical protein A2682_01370 [Candidatus Terrybacteria bacterium RIFCSPHIGHO2_01_FULL_58_15]OHA53785.1 MAG: hypothetical protein A2991_00865 [Candidatus Terrybacteria bacterium RIFCSPLOWO2_01_FULL_58_14]